MKMRGPSYFAAQAERAAAHGDFRRSAILCAMRDEAQTERERRLRDAQRPPIDQLCRMARQARQGIDP